MLKRTPITHIVNVLQGHDHAGPCRRWINHHTTNCEKCRSMLGKCMVIIQVAILRAKPSLSQYSMFFTWLAILFWIIAGAEPVQEIYRNGAVLGTRVELQQAADPAVLPEHCILGPWSIWYSSSITTLLWQTCITADISRSSSAGR